MTTLLKKINNSHLESQRLGDLLSAVIDKRGITPKKLGSDWVSTGIPVISAKNIKNHSIVNRDQIRFIDEKTYKKWMPNPTKAGDIILTSEAPMGELYVIKDGESFCLGQRLFGLRTNPEKLTPSYLFHFLQSSQGQHELNRRISGTAAEGIRQAELVNIEIKTPDLSTQEKVSEILSTYDAKIQNNDLIIKNLQTIAQTIFDEWFSRFHFPGYEETSFTGDGSDQLPKGWSVKKLGELCDISIGRTPPREQKQWFSKNPSDIKWISIKDLGSGGMYISKTDEFLTREAVEKFNIPVIPKNTLVVSFKLTVGRIAITTEEMLSNEAIAHLKIANEKEVSLEYLYCFMNNYDYESLASTSSIAIAVNSKTIKNIDVAVPSKNLVTLFSKKTAPIFQKILIAQTENKALKESRDQLLAKLI